MPSGLLRDATFTTACEVCKLGEGVSRVRHRVKCDFNCDCVVVAQRHDVGGVIHLAAEIGAR